MLRFTHTATAVAVCTGLLVAASHAFAEPAPVPIKRALTESAKFTTASYNPVRTTDGINWTKLTTPMDPKDVGFIKDATPQALELNLNVVKDSPTTFKVSLLSVLCPGANPAPITAQLDKPFEIACNYTGTSSDRAINMFQAERLTGVFSATTLKLTGYMRASVSGGGPRGYVWEQRSMKGASLSIKLPKPLL